MKKVFLFPIAVCVTTFFFWACNDNTPAKPVAENKSSEFGGYPSNIEWGEHLVTICGCHDCHSPKKFGPGGMQIDSSRILSGHPADAPEVNVNAGELQSKGVIATSDLTSWVGPWGISYTANLTPDETGLGAWNEGQFMYAIRNGKYKGMENSRPLLPPMPWDMYKNMSDDELKAIFSYLKSIKPIKNMVPAPKPPAGAPPKA